MKEIHELFFNISVYSARVILVIGWFLHFRRGFNLKYQPILWLLVASAFCDWLGQYMRYEYANNMPSSHLYGLLHGGCLIWFFALNVRNRKSILSIGGIYLIFYIFNSLFVESLFTYNAIAKVTQNVLFIVLSFWYFFDVYKYESNLDIEFSGIFWIVVGILIYHSGALFTSLFAVKILSIKDESIFSHWILHNIAGTIKNLLFLLGLWMGRTRLLTK